VPPTADGTVTMRRYRRSRRFGMVRGRAQVLLPIELRQQLLDAIYAVQELGLTPDQVRGLTKTDDKRSTALDAALMATRRDDLKHGTNAAYVRGCVCSECREHQRERMARNG
jgi:hypothetical protein